ncbi:hypothetical protein, partial [Paracoccus sp. S4493]|uniref:hypothetical protein n=1 Tax=Paracoccus sp. S4493 TaxID=579490 RepID=UPI00194F0E9D
LHRVDTLLAINLRLAAAAHPTGCIVYPHRCQKTFWPLRTYRELIWLRDTSKSQLLGGYVEHPISCHFSLHESRRKNQGILER